MDLKGFAAGENSTAGGRGFAGITERPPVKPAVAAVEGYALAGGFEIALACDLIVASEEAVFGLPEVTRGLVAGREACSGCRSGSLITWRWRSSSPAITYRLRDCTRRAWSTGWSRWARRWRRHARSPLASPATPP